MKEDFPGTLSERATPRRGAICELTIGFPLFAIGRPGVDVHAW